MATIDSKSIVDELIESNGFYEDDPRVALIVQYTNQYGNITYGVTWSNESAASRERYLTETKYVKNPKVIWRADEHIVRDK